MGRMKSRDDSDRAMDQGVTGDVGARTSGDNVSVLVGVVPCWR